MQAQALEHNMDFERMMAYATPHVGERWPFMHWLVHTLCHLMGTLSVYDYASRVHMAKEMLEAVNPSHTSAARLSLEQIIANLTPRPETIEAATQGLGAGPASAGGDGQLVPLDDEPILDPALPALRQEVLARAFILYCDVGIEALHQDMEEEEYPAFEDFHAKTMKKVTELAEELKARRKTMYADFPAEELTSVSDEIVLKRRTVYTVHDKLEGTAKMGRIQEEIESLESTMRSHLRETLSNAKRQLGHLRHLERRYLHELKNLDFFKCAVAGNLDANTLANAEQRLVDLEKAIKNQFAPQHYFPEEVLEDMQRGCLLYRDGEF